MELRNSFATVAIPFVNGFFHVLWRDILTHILAEELGSSNAPAVPFAVSSSSAFLFGECPKIPLDILQRLRLRSLHYFLGSVRAAVSKLRAFLPGAFAGFLFGL